MLSNFQIKMEAVAARRLLMHWELNEQDMYNLLCGCLDNIQISAQIYYSSQICLFARMELFCY